MAFVFVDRESTYPNKYKVTKDDGTTYYVLLERADEPVVEGTPLNAETFRTMMAACLPDITDETAGKILAVVDGVACWVSIDEIIPDGDEVAY